MTTLAGQTTKDDAVKPSCEIQRHQGQRHDVPGVTDDRFNQGEGEARPNNASDEPGHTRERVGRADTSSHLTLRSKAGSAIGKPCK